MTTSVLNRYRFHFKPLVQAAKPLVPQEPSAVSVHVLYEDGFLKFKDSKPGLCHKESACANLLHFARENAVRPITRAGDADGHMFFIPELEIPRFMEALGKVHTDFSLYVLDKMEADKNELSEAEIAGQGRRTIGKW